MLQEIIQTQLEEYFKQLQRQSRTMLKQAIKQACTDKQFEKIEIEYRQLQLQYSKAAALNQDTKNLSDKIKKLSDKRNLLAHKNNINLQTIYQCPICKDSGYVDGNACQCRHAKYIDIVRQVCSPKIPNFTFENNKYPSLSTPQNKIFSILYDKMQQVCDNFDTTRLSCFLLMGEVGIGKTSIAAAVGNRLLSIGKTVIYRTAFELGNILKCRHLTDISTPVAEYQYLFDCDMLIIDDLGTEPLYKNITLNYFLSLIDSRIMSAKKTMICTNLKPQQFAERYGERALSRFTDTRYSIRVNYINGDDLRHVTK